MKIPFVLAGTALALFALAPRPASAHCDTLDGPVVVDARAALESRDITPVLKWVGPAAEGQIREAFQHALAVRALGPEARGLADRFFFETLVRVHREGEGAPFTGLKPAGSADPGFAASDKALESGSVDPLVKQMTADLERGVRQRFEHALGARKHAGHDVEAGRAYVAAYVQFMHYVERLMQDVATDPAHGAAGDAHGTPAEHKH